MTQTLKTQMHIRDRFKAERVTRNGVETWEAFDAGEWLATFEGPSAEADALREITERRESILARAVPR